MVQNTKNPSNTNKNTNITKIPHSGLHPQNRQKLPKKYENGHFLTIFFVVFRFFFWCSTRNGGFVFFPGLRGVCILCHPREISTITVFITSRGFMQNKLLPTAQFEPQLNGTEGSLSYGCPQERTLVAARDLKRDAITIDSRNFVWIRFALVGIQSARLKLSTMYWLTELLPRRVKKIHL